MGLKVYIETYGCALNKSDEYLMRKTLENRGHRLVDTVSEADVVIINTCTVRLDTEYKMLNRIRELREQCKISSKRLIVAGCMAKVQPYTINLVAPEASLVSPQNASNIHLAVENSSKIILLEGLRERNKISICKGTRITPIPIQEGCLSNCSFCIAKYARRRLVSHDIEAIVDAIKKAIVQDTVEIELTGMDLGTYGIDIYGKRTLPMLLKRITSEVKGNYMIRIGMINPEHLKYIIDELIEVIKDSGNIYKFLHIPLQSGSDRVLKLMNRKYSIDEYRAVVKEIKNKIPDISIATDIIVGHPGESEEDFEETLHVIKELSFERVHLAGYSMRPLTLSASMPQIHTKIKKERVKKALNLIMEVGLKVRERYLGTKVKVFVTEKTNTWIARLDNYIPVVIRDGYNLDYGLWINVYIDEITFFDIRGYVVN